MITIFANLFSFSSLKRKGEKKNQKFKSHAFLLDLSNVTYRIDFSSRGIVERVQVLPGTPEGHLEVQERVAPARRSLPGAETKNNGLAKL